MNFIVYKTTNLINGKIYIGVHYTDPTIDDTYRGCGCTKKDKKLTVKKGFPVAFRKYGFENFKRETLFIYPDTLDGEKQAYLKEAEIVDEAFVAREDTYNLVVGGDHVPSECLKKPIAQYTLNGKFIRKWDCIKDAEQELNLTSISSVLIERAKYCGEWQWKYYVGIESELDIAPVETREKTVYQFDLQGNLIKVWKNAIEASKQFNNPNSARVSINNCCLGKTHQTKGYFWSFKNKFTYIPSKNTGLPTAVAKYDDAGEFLESYSSISEAAKANNIKGQNSITKAIEGKQKRCGGFRWRYFYGNKDNIKPLKDV